MIKVKRRRPRVAGRSQLFQDYLDQLSPEERLPIEVNEAIYLRSLAGKLASLERVLDECMLGAEDRPAPWEHRAGT
jgi:hypothetical protein